MPHLDHTAFVNACRDERGVGHHTLRAYAQDLWTFARFTKDLHLTDPLPKPLRDAGRHDPDVQATDCDRSPDQRADQSEDPPTSRAAKPRNTNRGSLPKH